VNDDMGSVPHEIGVERSRAALYNAVEGVIAEGLSIADVTEVIVDPNGSVWFDRISTGMQRQHEKISAGKLRTIILSIAGLLGKKIADGILEGELPLDGSRIEAVLQPVSLLGPTLVIRKHRKQGVDGWPALTVMDYGLHSKMLNRLHHIVASRANFAIFGATSAGKTTFGGAMLNLISVMYPQDRVITIEDTAELYCISESYLPLHATEQVSQRQLVKAAMRLRPDSLIMGEVRDDAALDMVSALGTGHRGFTTVHGGSFQAGLNRIRQLCRWKGETTIDPGMIADAIPNLIQMARMPDGKRMPVAIAEVKGWRDEKFILEPLIA
jgi:Flp pilus assembly CpaF family ATPase